MSENAALEVIWICITLINGMGLFILIGIWKRMYSHYHIIDCTNKACDARKTGDVIVPHESA
jgi:hypothetical protein